MKLYLVWNPGKTECVGFDHKNDQIYTATGRQMDFATPAIGDAFREMYAEDDDAPDELPMSEIEVPE